MSEEIKDEEGIEGTYASRMNDVASQAREDKFKALNQKKKSSVQISDDEKEFARLLLDLMQHDNFKRFMQFEAMEAGKVIRRAFDEVSDAVLKTDSFGEKMAFNKGRYYQIEHWKHYRDNVVSRYLEYTKLEEEASK